MIRVSVLCDDKRFSLAFRKLCEADLPIPVAFKLAELKRRMGIEIDKFIDLKKKMIEDYGTRDAEGKVVYDAGGQVQLDPSRAEEWRAKFADLQALTCELEPVALGEAGNHVKLSADDVSALGAVVTL